MKNLLMRVRQIVKGFGPIGYHIGIVSLSATIAMLLPYVGQGLLSYWDLASNQKVFLVTAEILVAVLLILFFHHFRQSLYHKKMAAVAKGAGLVNFFPEGGRLAREKITLLRQAQGLPRHVMIIGSTGRTFVDPRGDSYAVLKHCLEAKIMLLNPCSENAKVRATSILHPEVTLDTLKTQARQTIEFLKLLKAARKNVTLKLYSDDPNVKLAILGEHVWLQHYHTTLDVQSMPMYVFQYNPAEHGLYTIFYQHFVSKWENPDTPEYDLESDELVYRWPNGAERHRERFCWEEGCATAPPRLVSPSPSLGPQKDGLAPSGGTPSLVAMDALQATG